MKSSHRQLNNTRVAVYDDTALRVAQFNGIILILVVLLITMVT